CKFQSVEIFRNYEPNLPPVQVDADLIKEVITNILDNGLDAMKGAGNIKVAIKLDQTGNALLLSITNSGSVLAEELQDKIFEPFFTTKDTGMGLGLAIVKQV